MNGETPLKKAIVDAINATGLAKVWSVPSGRAKGGKIRLAPEGTPDVCGYQRRDGRAVFVEVKRPKGHRRESQVQFIQGARTSGCIAGFAESVQEAIDLILSASKEAA